MRVIVTGASGFLGRALLRRLAQENVDVIGVSRRALPDMVHVASYGDAPEGDVLVHMGESGDRSWVNGMGDEYGKPTLRTLTLLANRGYSRIVYLSTAVLYGDAFESPRSIHDQVFLTDTYTRHKFASERHVLERGGMVARLVNTYGPGMPPSNVLSAILSQLRHPGPVSLLDVSPIRDFLWVDDAVSALAMMAVGAAPSGVFNVGTGVGTSVHQLASMVLSLAGEKGRAVEARQPGKRRSCLTVDYSETVEVLGWRPETALLKGVTQLLDQTRT